MSPWHFPPLDQAAAESAIARQAQLTKPAGSLGCLERIPPRLAALQGTPLPSVRPAAAIIFAADHPVTRHGVSAFPSAVTAVMVQNFVRGGAAASVLARELDLPLTVVDVGVMHPYEPPPEGEGASLFRDPAADAAVGDLRSADALGEGTLDACLAAGARAVDRLPEGTRLLALGEMGIGNTTPASAIAAALLGREASEVVGAGTGVAGEALRVKIEVVNDALARLRGEDDARRVLEAVGGREIAACVGAAARAIEGGIAVLVDGFIVSAAMLALVRMAPLARGGLFFGHRSRERGHRLILEALDADPLLDLDLALGEASGALTALPLVELACALHRSMATFAEAGVPGPVE